jgi:hypothetical protein
MAASLVPYSAAKTVVWTVDQTAAWTVKHWGTPMAVMSIAWSVLTSAGKMGAQMVGAWVVSMVDQMAETMVALLAVPWAAWTAGSKAGKSVADLAGLWALCSAAR